MFRKNERGELKVNDNVKAGDVIICNNTSIIDFIYLELAYSPLFTVVAIDEVTKKHGFRKLSLLEIPFHAMGLKFPSEVASNKVYDDLLAMRESQYVKRRPIVIFPEATKSNGRGILNFEPEITEIIINAAQTMSLHTLRFDFEFDYYSPYNTTDVLGLKSMFKLMSQLRNVFLIQCYFNLEEKLMEIPDKEEKYDFIRRTMMPRGKEYSLKLGYKEHIEFLGYWLNTRDKGYANKNRKF